MNSRVERRFSSERTVLRAGGRDKREASRGLLGPDCAVFPLTPLLPLLPLLLSLCCACNANRVAVERSDAVATISIDEHNRLAEAEVSELFVRRALVFALLDENEYAQAWPHIEFLQNHGDVTPLLNLASAQTCLYWRLDYECVDLYAGRAVQALPENSRAHLYLGQSAHDQRQWERAEYHYRQSIASRRSTQASTALARVLEAQGRPDEAVAVIQMAIENQRRDPHLLLQLAGMVEEQDPVYAESLLTQAVAYLQEPIPAYHQLLRLYLRQGRVDEAEDVRALVESMVEARDMRPLR